MSRNVKAGDVAFSRRRPTEAERREDEDTARLVRDFQTGDSEAFATLYQRYFDRVYGYMRVLLKDQHEAEDATSEVWLKVYEALPRYQRRKQPFRAWLFVVVRNTGLDRVAAKARLEPFDPAELDSRREAPAPENALNVLDWITDKDLMIFVQRLPQPQRQVLALRFLLDLRPPEIAKVLGRTRTDVSTLQYRALRFLEERLDAIGRSPKVVAGAESKAGELEPMRRWGVPATVTRSRRFAIWENDRRKK
jgi:RNA polymerase sigma-70 factor (ECF subfamily)